MLLPVRAGIVFALIGSTVGTPTAETRDKQDLAKAIPVSELLTE
jgi:hypothetical protein